MRPHFPLQKLAGTCAQYDIPFAQTVFLKQNKTKQNI